MKFDQVYNQTSLTLKQAINKVEHLEDVKTNLETRNKLFFENESIKWWNLFVCSEDRTSKQRDYSLAFQFIADHI